MSSKSKVDTKEKVVEAEVVQEKAEKEYAAPKPNNVEKKNLDPSKYSNGIFLIFLGVFLLLNTLGVVPWSAWLSVVKFWPMLIIFAGLNVMFGKNRAMQWVLLVVSTLVWLGILIFVLFQNSDIPSITGNTTLQRINDRFENVAEQGVISSSDSLKIESYQNAKQMDIDFKLSTGKYFISDAPSATDLMKVESIYSKSFGELNINKEETGDKLLVNIEQSKSRSMFFRGVNEASYKVVTNREFPISITTNIAAGEGRIEIMDENLLGIDAEVAAGDLDITLGDENVDGAMLDLDIAAGKITLDLPEEVGYDVNYDIGAGEARMGEVQISGLGKRGLFRSSNYDDAEYKVSIVVKVGAGEFIIK